MRKIIQPIVESARLRYGRYASNAGYGNNGAFTFFRKGARLNVMVSDRMGWDHVSVSVEGMKRLPTWEEMCFVKELFFDEEETVVQIHPPRSKHVSVHEVLHMWRKHGAEHPLPPKCFI